MGIGTNHGICLFTALLDASTRRSDWSIWIGHAPLHGLASGRRTIWSLIRGPEINLLKKRRTKEKLDIERCYWEKFRHVPYEIVFKEDMNVVFAENIRIVSKFYNASSVFDEMSMLKHMIATKRIQVDMESEPLDFPYLLEQYREALPEVKGGAPVCQIHST